ncbi:MAG: VWA domain-containing protein [Spirochaetota bacterium]|nr:VWA domain-containing protein [Spirochaetota bacterium]
MKLLLIRIAILLSVGFTLPFLLNVESSVYAGPFLKINRIDSESAFPKINIFLTIQNIDHSLITGLNEENIQVYEDGYRVNYIKVKSQSKTKGFLSLVFSIDSSRSISKIFLKEIKKSAKEIANSIGPMDKIALFRFNDDVTLLSNFSSNKLDIYKKIERITTHGKKTLLYNCIYDSIDLLHKADVPKKAVIVFTDGRDEGSSVRIEDIIAYSKEASIPIYFICLKSSEHINTLARISKLTGGNLIFSNGNGAIDSMYNTILNRIKSQYIVKYQSILEPDGKAHTIDVRLKYDHLRDQASANLEIKKKINLIYMPSLSEILLISLILLLIALLIFIVVYSFRKNNNLIETLTQSANIVKMYPDNKTDDCCEINSSDENHIPSVIATSDRNYSKSWLMQKDKSGNWNKIRITPGDFTFGSEEGNNVIIKSKAVSPIHAKIKAVNDYYYLFDLASDTGTFINDKKLLRPKQLIDWDEVRIGKANFIFRGTNLA